MCLQQGGGDTLVARRSRCIFLLFFSYLCCCWATGVSPLLELLSFLFSYLAGVRRDESRLYPDFVVVGRQECRPSLSCFRFFLVTFAGVRRDESRLYPDFVVVGRQECRPSLSCFYYYYSYYLRLPNVFATRRGDTLVARRSRCIFFVVF